MRIPIIGLLALIACLPPAAWSEQSPNLADATSFETYPDPALGNLVRVVVGANPRVQAARSALEAARAYESAAGRPLYNPEIEVDYENAVDRTWAVGLGQTIDWSDKRAARSSVGASDRRAVEAEYLAARRDLAVEVLGGLALYETGVRRDALAAERVQAMQDFAQLARRRFDAGDLNQVEADLATLVLVDAQIQRAAAAAGLAAARQAVQSLILNSTPDQWPPLDADLPLIPGIGDPQKLALNLPEIQAAQRRVDRADALIELRSRERRPDPTLSLRGGREDDDSLVGVSLSIPLYIRNSYRYEVSAAVAERNQAQQLADDALRRAYTRLISASERYRLSRDAWQNWQRTGLVSLQRQGDFLQRLWDAGELSTTDFLVQLRQTLDTREHALELELTLWQAWFEWLAASGQVDSWLGLEQVP